MVDVRITKQDEVYLRIDCDLEILYELEPAFTFEVPGAKFSPKFKMKIWDGKIRLLSIYKRQLYVGLHDALCKKISDLGYSFESNVEDVDNQITPEKLFNYVQDLKLHTQGKVLDFRDYQYDAIHTALKYKRQTILSPTASGKSAIIYTITRWLLEDDMKVLIIVPTTQLVYQMIGDFKDYSHYNGWDADKNCHVIMAGKDKISTKNVCISTWQSLQKDRVSSDWVNQFGCIIVDECHQAKATEIGKLLEKATSVKYRLGFTGSLDNSKTNKFVIQGLFGPITKVITTRELIDAGHLSDIYIKCLVLKYNKDSASLVKHMDYQKEIEFLVSHEKRNRFITNLAVSLKGNTLILYTLVEKHGDVLYNLLKEKVGDRELCYVHGGVDAEERDEVRRIMETSNDAITLASAGTFSQGVNIRRLHNIIFASPTKSVVRVLQSLGRGLRKASDKDLVNVYDISDMIHKSKTKQNYTYTHLIERLRIYTDQQFNYKIIEVQIE
jgi:superfamily II DNA or RNA helicase